MGSKKSGFAALTPEAHRAVSRLGGIAAHEQGTGHEWTSEEAREAGKRGGKAASAKHWKRAAEAATPLAPPGPEPAPE